MSSNLSLTICCAKGLVEYVILNSTGHRGVLGDANSQDASYVVELRVWERL